jgi:hypothetical protein
VSVPDEQFLHSGFQSQSHTQFPDRLNRQLPRRLYYPQRERTDVEYELFWNGTSTGNIQTGPGPLNFGPSQIRVFIPSLLQTQSPDVGQISLAALFLMPVPRNLFSLRQDLNVPVMLSESADRKQVFRMNYGVQTAFRRNAGYIGTWIGDGSPLDFGNQTIPGTYSVHAINMFTGCDIYFSDTKILWPLPEQYNITPQGPPICGMTTIGLSNSQRDIHTKSICWISRIAIPDTLALFFD